jgi:hypothetical protein
MTTGAFASVASSYRVVGWGVRLKNVTKPVDVYGDVSVGILPCGGRAPTQCVTWAGDTGVSIALPAGDEWEEFRSYASLPTTAYATAPANVSIPVLYNADTLASFDNFTAQEIAETGGILIKPKVHSPATAWRFHRTEFSGDYNLGSPFPTRSGGPHHLVGAPNPGQGGNQVWNANLDFLDSEGHNVVVIQFGAATGQTYEIEVIYHVEMIPIVTTSASGNFGLQANATARSPTVPRPMLDSVLYKVLNSPFVEFLKHEGSQALRAAQQALPGLMSKAMMAALA